MNEWQPIDRAPKDGTEIVGVFWRDYDGNGKATIYGPWTVRWCSRARSWISSWDGERVIESQTDFGTDYKSPDPEITHWTPLPDPRRIATQ